MRKIVLGSCVLVLCMFAATSSFTEIVEDGEFRSDTEHTITSTLCGDIHDRIICVDGFKVFQTVAYGSGNNNQGVAVSNIQIYEAKDGKVVPATCNKKELTPK